MGNLEKKKDYKQRATDYQEKQKRLKELHKKALERNPEEFYFHMKNSKTLDGVHIEKPEEDDDSEAQRVLLASQDLRYVNFKLGLEQKKIEKLKSHLHMLGGNIGPPSKFDDRSSESGGCRPVNTHTFFVESAEELRNFDPAERLQTHPSTLGRTFNRPRISQLIGTSAGHGKSASEQAPRPLTKADLKSTDKERKRSYRELLKRMDRCRELRVASSKLALKQQLAQWRQTVTEEEERRKRAGLRARDGRTAKPVRVRRGTSKRAAQYVFPMERKK
jgi:U3 small nucleolar RNA-associated protein 11